MQHWQHLMESGTDPNSPLNTMCVSKRSAVFRSALSRSLCVPEDFTKGLLPRRERFVPVYPV